MAQPVRIYIDRKELVGFTDMRLKRSKNDMTGELNVTVFMGWVPDSPPMVEATAGREILVYIGNQLAFNGKLDRRQDNATRSDTDTESKGGNSINLGPNQYTVAFTARGKTKYLVDSSHQHKTGTVLRPTNRSLFETLLDPFGIDLVWEAEEIQLDKQRFHDGGLVVDELQRIAEQTSLFTYENRLGQLVVRDSTTSAATVGESLILGRNILTFSTDQAEDTQRSQVQVKGQRIEKELWGDVAVLPTLQTTKDALVNSFIPITVQLYGNATEELLERRANYEANKRAAQSKRVEVTVFHVQQTNGVPWDVGDQHYVEIPPVGVQGIMEVLDVEYSVDATNILQTRLTLSPPPAPPKSTSATGTSTQLLSGVSTEEATLSPTEGLPVWGSPDLSYSTIVEDGTSEAAEILSQVSDAGGTPPLTLPTGS